VSFCPFRRKHREDRKHRETRRTDTEVNGVEVWCWREKKERLIYIYRDMFTTRTLGRWWWCSSSARQQLLDVGGNTTKMAMTSTTTTTTMRSTMIAGIMARSISSDFAEQMKSYETKVFLPNSSPIVVRLDGSSFRFESISLSPS